MTAGRAPRNLLVLAVVAVTGGLVGCGDDGPTTTAARVPPAMLEQGSRGGTATGTTPGPVAGRAGDVDLDGARPVREAQAAPVRAGLRAFARAVIDRDAPAACTHVVGFEELLRRAGRTGSCETLLPNIGNTAAGPSPRDVSLIDASDVLIAGDRATVSIGSEAPVPMRRVGGAWKLDYAAFAAAPKER